jgi:hypothetical protein
MVKGAKSLKRLLELVANALISFWGISSNGNIQATSIWKSITTLALSS